MSRETSVAIRTAGLRATTQRIALLSYLASQKHPVSVQRIADSVRPTIDVVTAYRNIGTFVTKGLARRIDIHEATPLFEIADEHDHHHVVCTSCKRVEDFEGCNAPSLAKTALSQVRTFASISAHSIELFGLCKKCTT